MLCLIINPYFVCYRCWYGYIVVGMDSVHNGVLQYSITVQSSIKPAAYLHGRIEAWLSSYGDKLASLTEAEFQQNLTAVIEERQIKPKTLSAQTDRYWREVTRQRFLFDIIDRYDIAHIWFPCRTSAHITNI
jgi:insulysin